MPIGTSPRRPDGLKVTSTLLAGPDGSTRAVVVAAVSIVTSYPVPARRRF